MTFKGWISSPRSRNTWHSWWSMMMTFPLLVGVAVGASGAWREADVAKRQQTTEGIVTAYDRYNHNRCSYQFLVSGKQYKGERGAGTTGISIGDHVLVHYDSQDPTMNALEDFAEMSDRDAGFVYVLLFVILIFTVSVVVAKSQRYKDKIQAGER